MSWKDCVLSFIPSRPFVRYFIGNYNHFKILCLKSVKLVKDQYKAKDKPKSKNKTIVIVFNGRIINAGLTDNLKAICSIYYWSKQNDYIFKIYYTHPFKLNNYLLPNKYNWICSNEVSYKEAIPKALISCKVIYGDSVNRSNQLRYLESFKQCKEEQIHIYSNTDCYDETFHEMYHELFKPTDTLQKRIDYYKDEIGENFISVSFRFTQLLGDLKDTYGVELSEEDKSALIHKCVDAILPLINENEGVTKAFVTSDSQRFLSEVYKLPYVYILPGAVNHIAQNASDEAIKKTFLDMYMISNARKAYMVRTPIMYKSGFAKHGALIGGIPFEERVI